MAGRPRKSEVEVEDGDVVETIAWGNVIYNAATGEQIGLLEESPVAKETEVVLGSPNEQLFAAKTEDN